MRSSRALAPEAAAPTAPPRFRAPLIMGVVNATPDSFYPGSRAPSVEEAVARGLALVRDGADLLDVGGQSTRPGSDPVPVEEELARVIPVLRALSRATKVPLSVDTDKAAVAQAALDAGATVLNDVTALRGDRAMARVAVRYPRVVLMHMLGTSPKTMQADPRYGDVVAEVRDFLAARVAAFAEAGGDPARVWADPGVGFGKTLEHNLALIARLGELAAVAPVLLGVSRKSFLGKLTPDSGPEDRLPGSLALAAWAGFAGAAAVRVHDVAETRKAFAALNAVSKAS